MNSHTESKGTEWASPGGGADVAKELADDGVDLRQVLQQRRHDCGASKPQGPGRVVKGP